LKKIVLVGSGGHAISVIDVIQSAGEYSICGLIDLPENIGKKVMGYEVVGADDCLEDILSKGVSYAAVTVGSVGDTLLRQKLFDRLKKIGYLIPNIVDPTAVVSRNAELGEGIYIGKRAVINASSRIGDMAIINTGSIIEHGCDIGQFVHISPGAVICGGVNIGDYAHIGANATVIQGLYIGQGAIIGAASVVTHDISDYITAFGNPCREVKDRL